VAGSPFSTPPVEGTRKLAKIADKMEKFTVMLALDALLDRTVTLRMG
jgi:hypothetical protein